MKIIVYGNTYERAIEKLDEIYEAEIDKDNILSFKKSKEEYSIIMKNSDIYIAKHITEGCRGYRWQYAYVDNDISAEKLKNIIFAKFMPINIDGTVDSNEKIEDCYEIY